MIWLTLIIFGCGLILWGYVPGVDFWTIWVTFKLIPFLTTFLTRSTTFSTLVQPLVQPNYLPYTTLTAWLLYHENFQKAVESRAYIRYVRCPAGPSVLRLATLMYTFC